VLGTPAGLSKDDFGEPFQELLRDPYEGGAHSTVHVLWATPVEVVPTSKDIGGWEPSTLAERLATEAIRGSREFHGTIEGSLSDDHFVSRYLMGSRDPDEQNEAFFAWQRALFSAAGDVAAARLSTAEAGAPLRGANTTWPQLQELPEYARIHKVVDRLSRRYLERSGLKRDVAQALKYSVFSWASVYGGSQMSLMRSSSGVYHVALYFAKAGKYSGKLRLTDPRGSSDPFGRTWTHAPRSGDLVLFPSWVKYMLTPGDESEGREKANVEPETVVYTFHVQPETGIRQPQDWWVDPLADIRFSRPAPLSTEMLKAVLY